MRIGLYHEPVHTDGRTYDTYDGYARYILEYARHFEQVTVFAPTTRAPTRFSGCPLNAPNVTVAPLPYFLHHRQAYRLAPAIVRVFRRHCATLDVIEARGTAPLAYVLWWLTRGRGVPFIYHFASDPFEVMARDPTYHGWYGCLAWAAYSFEFAIQRHIIRRNYCVADGSGISERLRRFSPQIEPVVHSTLAAEDYFQREDSCTGPVVRVLFVGALRAGKRADDLIAAVSILRRAGRNVELEVVGDGPQRPALVTLAAQCGVQDAVHFHGHVALAQLNGHYNAADVLALPSLSEGSPRVVLEAMGHSLPVVATPVGNVAEMLEAGGRGVLVPMKDPAALAAGIARLMDDGDFRRRCIREGYAYARQHGLDVFVARMASKARELVAASCRRCRPC